MDTKSYVVKGSFFRSLAQQVLSTENPNCRFKRIIAGYYPEVGNTPMRDIRRDRINATSKRASEVPLSDDRESGLPCHDPPGRVPYLRATAE